MKRKGLFITGTDTDVGKTYITKQIIEQLNQISYPTKVRKPIESGCALNSKNELIPSDGNTLWHANAQKESLDIVTPYRFQPAIAPNRAAALADQTITTDDLFKACINGVNSNDFLIVEGAGGFYSPLSSDGHNCDLAFQLKNNIILVVKDQLGCINHTLLTLQAIKYSGLSCILIVLNQSSDVTVARYDHVQEIKKLTAIPLIQCFIHGLMPDITALIDEKCS